MSGEDHGDVTPSAASVISQNDTTPESSYKASPHFEPTPLILTASAPNKRKKYVRPSKPISSRFSSSREAHDDIDSAAYTQPLLGASDMLNVNSNDRNQKPPTVLHRSLMDDNTLRAIQPEASASMLSRRHSADETNNASPVQTYVVLHEANYNYQCLNENTHARSSTFYSESEQSQKHRQSQKTSVRKIERLEFDVLDNEISFKQWKYDKFGQRGLAKWVICLFIGIITGLFMYIITVCIQFLLNIVILKHTRTFLDDAWWKGTLYYLGCNVVCALIASMSVVHIEPAARGSGIPEVKSYLNGSWIPHLFNIRTLFVKLFGVTFAVSGSFIIGKEGPMVHTGAIVANGLSRGRSRTLRCDTKMGYSFRNDNDARSFISCGAAAGVSAAFGAPVGGMLFALEEVSSFWQSSLTWRAFFSAAVSAFFLDVLLSCYDNNSAGTCGEFTRVGLITFNDKNQSQSSLSRYDAMQLLAFLIIGACGGLIGALFNFLNIKLCYFRKYVCYPKHPKLYPILDVLFASMMTTLFIMVIPQFIYPKCTADSALSSCTDEICQDIQRENQFNCNDGEFNGLSALLLGEREQIIKYVFHYESAQFFEPVQLLICCIAYFILAVYTYGLYVPSGLFIPLILIGSTFGWFFGFYWDKWIPGVHSQSNLNTYALMGASALLGGSTRMTISLTAIIMEITNDIYYLLPIMLVVMMSKWVGDRFNGAIYEAHVSLSNIPYLEHSLPKWVPTYLCAKDVMTKNVMCLPIICPLRIINRYLRDKDKLHNAFPIIDCEANKAVQQNYLKKDGKFVGIMLRWHIMIILSKRNFAPIDKLSELPLLTPNDLTDSDYKNRYIRSYQKQFKISWHELNTCYIDFSPYMHLSPFTVQTYTPIHRVYTLFRGLGLRHLIVLDKNNKFVDGIITTKNLQETELEHCVEKMNHKIKENEMSNNDYVCHRLQHMNSSQVAKKYKVSKRFMSVDSFVSTTHRPSPMGPEKGSVSKLSVATNERDMASINDEYIQQIKATPQLNLDDTVTDDENENDDEINVDPDQQNDHNGNNANGAQNASVTEQSLQEDANDAVEEAEHVDVNVDEDDNVHPPDVDEQTNVAGDSSNTQPKHDEKDM